MNDLPTSNAATTSCGTPLDDGAQGPSKSFDLAAPKLSKSAPERSYRAQARSLQKTLAKARTLQGLLKKSSLLSDTPCGDLRGQKISSLKRKTSAAITKINTTPKSQPNLLVPLNSIHPTLKGSSGADLDLGFTKAELKELLKVPEYSSTLAEQDEITRIQNAELEQPFTEMLESGSDKARKANWQWRIGEEAEQKQKEGFYPYMGTLTYDRTLFPYYGDNPDFSKGPIKPLYQSARDMWQQGRELQYYFDDIARTVCKELGHPAFNRKDALHPRSYYLVKFAIQEHGSKGTNDHMHYIMWLRAVPASWKSCPNHGIRNPEHRTRRMCKPLNSYWKFGFSQVDYFRSVGDIWSAKYGFVTPVDKKGKPMKIRPPREAGGYFLKYLSKEKKEFSHRPKATRGIGLGRLNAYIERLDLKTAEALSWRPADYEKYFYLQLKTTVPIPFIRAKAKEQVFYLKYMLGQIDPVKEVQPAPPIYARMIKSVHAGESPHRGGSGEKYNWFSQFIDQPENYYHVAQVIAMNDLARYFPPRPNYPETFVRIGANSTGGL